MAHPSRAGRLDRRRPDPDRPRPPPPQSGRTFCQRDRWQGIFGRHGLPSTCSGTEHWLPKFLSEIITLGDLPQKWSPPDGTASPSVFHRRLRFEVTEVGAWARVISGRSEARSGGGPSANAGRERRRRGCLPGRPRRACRHRLAEP